MKRSLRKIKQNAARKFGTVIPLALRVNELLKLSPVPELLASNVPPSEDEIPLILNSIAEMERTLADIDQALSTGPLSTQGSKNLRKRKTKCQEFLRIHRSFLSPLRRLPYDILAEIFTHVAYDELAIYSTPPWAISQTCSEWRALALDLPLLWNCFDVVFDEKHKTHSYLQFLEMLLNRSRNAPLDIFISVRSKLNYAQHPTIGILTTHSERWRKLLLHMSGQTLQAFKAIKGHLHSLELLTVQLYEPFPDQSMDIFAIAPQLHGIVVKGTIPNPLIIPWTQIRSYRDDFRNANMRDTILTSSSSLETLDFDCQDNGDFFIVSLLPIFPSVHLEELYRLSVGFPPSLSASEALPGRFLDGLTLPAMEELRLANYYGRIEPSVKSLIRQSHATLTKLELSSPPGWTQLNLPGTLTSILESVPQLTELITTLPNYDDLANLVDISDPQTSLVPSLEQLVLHIPSGINDGNKFEELMAALVASRCEITFRLVFYDLTQCLSTRERLEMFHRNHTLNEDLVTQERFDDLAILGSQFRKQLYQMSICISAASRKPLKANYPGADGISRQVLELFNAIDAIEFANAAELHVSQLHHLLYHVARTINDSDLANQDKLIFPWKAKAEAILDKWNPLLIEDLPSRRWAFQGFQSILCTPIKYASFQSDENMSLKKIYGIHFYGDKYDEHAWSTRFFSNLRCRD